LIVAFLCENASIIKYKYFFCRSISVYYKKMEIILKTNKHFNDLSCFLKQKTSNGKSTFAFSNDVYAGAFLRQCIYTNVGWPNRPDIRIFLCSWEFNSLEVQFGELFWSFLSECKMNWEYITMGSNQTGIPRYSDIPFG
jgi:hypothetical protein